MTAREPGSSRAQGVLVIVLAALALVGGVALGVGTTMFGGHVAPLARRLAGPVALPEHRLMAAAAVVLSLLAALGGVALARRASAASAPPRWLVALGRPYDVLRAAASGLGRAALFLHRSVGAMDRDVIDDVPRALGEVVVRAGRGLRGLLRGVGGRAGPSRDPAAGGVAVELSMVEPSTAERLRTALLLVMVALLGLVVLSSLLLG